MDVLKEMIMLIATLPTYTHTRSMQSIREILADPHISAVRYNTGGETPVHPQQIVSELTRVEKEFGKPIWIDLDGRQLRVAEWSLFSRGAVKLNRPVSIELPAKVFFRGTGWFDVAGISEDGATLYFDPPARNGEYFLGVSQSVHIIGRDVNVLGEYLSTRDEEYLSAAVASGAHRFMLSFTEDNSDIVQFLQSYFAKGSALKQPELIAKIESVKGVEWIQREASFIEAEKIQLMAARDDLYLAYAPRRTEIIDALRIISRVDPKAIVASRILSGLERNNEPTLADLEDILLMHQFGYSSFMLADELSWRLKTVSREWEDTVLPLLKESVM